MALHLSSSVANVAGIGAQAAADLRQLGVNTVRDLLFHIPFRYDDFSHKKSIDQLQTGDIVTVEARIRSVSARPAKSSRVMVTEAMVEDETGELKIVWFNQPYLAKVLKPGMQRAFSGRIDDRYGFSLTSPVHERIGLNLKTGRLIPIYRLCGSLNQSRLQNALRSARAVIGEVEDWVPESILDQEAFPSIQNALEALHFPKNQTQTQRALERLKFEELLRQQLLFARIREDRQTHEAQSFAVEESFLKQFVIQLPFELTDAQKKAIWRLVQDLAKDHPMNRLLQGDVGSGKTVVAATAIAHVMAGQGTCAYLAPTEILAIQQHATLSRLISDQTISLLTSSVAKIGEENVAKRELKEALKTKTIRCVVGTHALIQETLDLPDLSFVVVDEQHRFGVAQRHALLSRQVVAPHLLSMSATPIPRSLTLALYGDLDISVLREMPKGRKPIKTKLVSTADIQEMWMHIRKMIRARSQVYVVCPLIDSSDALGATSVKEAFEDVKKQLGKEVVIDLLHGRLTSDKKAEVLDRFVKREIDVLVSTTVVEVGVDVANATAMVILGAERFGLAQLHQLRGRVGRGKNASVCYLVPTDGVANDRLRAVVDCHDGFALAQADLTLRGAGDLFGTVQSGFTNVQFASVFDVELLNRAKIHADRILEKDPELKHEPVLHQFIQAYLDQVHLE